MSSQATIMRIPHDGSVLFLAVLFCFVQTNAAIAEPTGPSRKDPTTHAFLAKPGRSSSRSTRTKADPWFPKDKDKDIDWVIPPVTLGATCPLADVLSEAGKRTEELVRNVHKFTATEVVEHQRVDRSGRLRPPEIRRFSYLVSIAQDSSGYMNVEEYRKGGSSTDQFPDDIATVGTPSLVLIFHPHHV